MEKYLASLVSWFSFFINIFFIILIVNGKISINWIALSIILAAFLDMFDGRIARKYYNKKEDFVFGEVTDSLCDTINFGIVPVFTFLYFFKEHIFISLIISCFYLWATVFRLARFSRDKKDICVSYYFGLPVTVAGPISVLLIILFSNSLIISSILQIVLGSLMISSLKIKKI